MKNSIKKEDVKKIIRSLLLSTRHGLSVNELCQEYTSVTCEPLPYKDMGYHSAVDMIKDMPDVVKPIFLAGGAMLLKGIADSSTAHISQLVRNQKDTKGYNTKIITGSNKLKLTEPIVPDSIRRKIKDIILKYPSGVELNEFSKRYVHTYGRRLDFKSMGFTSLRSMLEKCSDIVTIKVRNLQNNLIFVYPVCVSCVSTKKEPLLPTPCKTDSMQLNNNYRGLPTSRSFVKSAVPHTIKMEIYFLLLKFKCGIWSVRFLFEYEILFKKYLNINQFGFDSVIEMMSSIPEIVHIHRPAEHSDWILQPVIQEEKLPAIVTSSPSTALTYTFKEGDIIDIYISYIISPSSFWFQQTEFTPQLDDLMERLNNFYNSPQSNLYIPDKVVAGQLCCALYHDDKQWYRAIIKNVSNNCIVVNYLDYGNESTLNGIASIRYMLQEFFTFLPFQSIQAKIANILPFNDLWSEEAVTYFFELTQDKPLQAEVVMLGGVSLMLNLFQNKASIAQILSQGGYGHLQHNILTNAEIKDGIKNLQHLYQVYFETLNQGSFKQGEKESHDDEKEEREEEQHKKNICEEPIDQEIIEKERLVKTVAINQDAKINIICHDQKAWVSSADVSSLFWNADILRQMTRQKGLTLSKNIISSSEVPELFSCLKKHEVQGQVKSTDSTIITLYPLEEVPKLFKIFKERIPGSQAIVEEELVLSRNINYWNLLDETSALKLKSLQFKKKRLHLSMMTNTAPSSALDDLKEIEKEINLIS